MAPNPRVYLPVRDETGIEIEKGKVLSINARTGLPRSLESKFPEYHKVGHAFISKESQP